MKTVPSLTLRGMSIGDQIIIAVDDHSADRNVHAVGLRYGLKFQTARAWCVPTGEPFPVLIVTRKEN